MTNRLALVLAVTAAFGCGGKKDDSADQGQAHGSAGSAAGRDIHVPGSGGSSSETAGSSAAPGQGSGMEGSAALQLPSTPAGRAQRFQDAWNLWVAGKFDKYSEYYAPDATSGAPGSPEVPAKGRAAIVAEAVAARKAIADQKGAIQLVLASEQVVIAITLVTGTLGAHTTGAYVGVVTHYDDADLIRSEDAYMDFDTITGQAQGAANVRPAVAEVTGRQVIVSKNDDLEKTNQEAIKKFFHAYSDHDAEVLGSLLADNLVWSDASQPKDLDKAGALASMKGGWTGPLGRLAPGTRVAAGDYVAVEETLDNAKPGAVAVPALAIYRLTNGQIAQAWVFSERSAAVGAKK